ncbi:MAG: hypothetical protein QME93_00610 [Bacillota bacterium]|nr:hypothetical protein [Bacillota bacterium]MDI7248555.1 hypothetical protein [Bacillota bacterium]
MSTLVVVICGNLLPGVKDEDNPFAYLRDERSQDVVMYVARNMPPHDKLYSEFGDAGRRIDNLFRVGALRQEGGRVLLNFTLFTREDHRILYDVAGRYAHELARALARHEREIRDLVGAYRRTGVSLEKVAFVAVGCFLLDWGSLEKLSEWGYMCRVRQQTGGTFTVTAEETLDLDLRAIYWGGHSEDYDGLLFLSFGDHASRPRRAFPDILWQDPFRVATDYDSPEARAVLSAYLQPLKAGLAQALRSLAGEEVNLSPHQEACKRWLQRLGYARDGVLSVPYFDVEDRTWLEPLSRLVFSEVRAWCEEYYAKLKEALADSTPVRHGVDYREVFRQVWHWVFGIANRSLAERALIWDTYEAGSRTPGYLPAAATQETLRL